MPLLLGQTPVSILVSFVEIFPHLYESNLLFKKTKIHRKILPQSVSSAPPFLLLHLSAETWTCFDFTLCWLERKTRSGSGAQLMGGVTLASESVGQREAGLGGTIHTLEAGSKSQAQSQTHWLVCVVKLFTIMYLIYLCSSPSTCFIFQETLQS